MGIPLRVLIVEDSEDDTHLLLRELKRGGYDLIFERVDTPAAMTDVLNRQTWDIVIADYSMPYFSAPEALKLLKKSGLDLPFIIVSGKIGEETAVSAMKAGAHDYIMKDKMARLIPAIDRELKEAKVRQERKHMEDALRESEERYRTLVENIDLGITLIDSSYRITMSNIAYRKMFDKFTGEFIGRECFRIFLNNNSVCDDCPGTLAMATGRVSVVEKEVIQDNQSSLYIRIHAFPLYDQFGMSTGFIEVVEDITDKKQVEELRLENEHLEYMNKAKSEFLAIISHELRTPLTSIIGYSILLNENKYGTLNEKQKSYIDNILSSSEHLLNLISDLLDMTRIETGKIELTIEQISVHAVIDETVEQVKQIAAKNNIIIKKEIDPQLDAIDVDKKRFKQILLNLVHNAIKFSQKEGGTVIITAKKEGDKAQFLISDTGIGIKKEDMGKIFTMFQQVDRGISRKYGGCGLGLSISKNLVEVHGGMISVESNYGKGSTFTFFLPLKQKMVTEAEDEDE